MRRSWMLLVLLCVAVAATALARMATAGPPATSAVGVEVQTQELTGLRPDGTTVTFDVKVVAQGADESSLVGQGRHFGSGGGKNYWPATGSINGTVVTLAGIVAESNNPLLVGAGVEVRADSSTGVMTLEFGPLPAGPPYNGGTIVADGFGTVKIRTS